MKYVKNTVLLLVLAILGVMLVPPGEEAGEERDGETGDRQAAEAVAYVIKFSAGSSYQPGARPHGIGEPLQGLTKVIEAFEARYPDTRIEIVSTPGVREYLVNHKPAYEISDGKGGKAWIGPQQWMKIARCVGKPLMIGEFGALPQSKSKVKIWKETPDYFESYADLEAAKPWVEKTLNDVIDSGVQLSYWWCYQSDRPMDKKNPQRLDLTVGRNPKLVKCIADANKRLQARLNRQTKK